MAIRRPERASTPSTEPSTRHDALLSERKPRAMFSKEDGTHASTPSAFRPKDARLSSTAFAMPDGTASRKCTESAKDTANPRLMRPRDTGRNARKSVAEINRNQ
jgi:hypothetical protein